MKHASLFSGIGGPEVAAAMLGWENVFSCEINPFGSAVLKYWFPNSVHYDDITKTDFTPWHGQIDVLTGGFPCQPFSYAGRRGGREDERYLWPQMLRAIDEIRPAWVVGENVAGITTMVEGGILSELGAAGTLFGEGDYVQRYELRQAFTIERICRDLERLGYSVQPVLIPAAAVNAPHRRDRIFIIAHADTDCGDRERQCEMERKFPGRDGSYCDGGLRDVTDTNGEGRQEPQQPGRGEDCKEDRPGADNRAERPGGYELFADAIIARLERENEPRNSEGGQRLRVRGNPSRHDWAYLSPEKRWADFPTISPIHRGNDGLPFNVDDLAISFSKWRTESLKAYGNAIVPQVMYRIFQAIEIANN